MSQTKAQLFDVSVEGPTALKNGAFDLTLGSGGNVTISDGNLVIPDGHGIDFSAYVAPKVNSLNTTVTANLLEDYEEGYFDVEVIQQGTSNAYTINSSTPQLKYIKIGRQVSIYGRFNLARGAASGAGMRLSLPFAKDTSFSNASADFNGLSVAVHDLSDTGASNTIGCFAEMGQTGGFADLFWLRNGAAWHSFASDDVSTSLNVSWIYVHGSYYAAV